MMWLTHMCILLPCAGDLVASAVMPGYSIVQQSKREVECPLEAPSGDFGGVAILRLSSPFPAGRSPAASQTVSGTLLLSVRFFIGCEVCVPSCVTPPRSWAMWCGTQPAARKCHRLLEGAKT